MSPGRHWWRYSNLACVACVVELVDQLERLVRRHPFDAFHAGGVDVERRAAVLGMTDHERLHGLRESSRAPRGSARPSCAGSGCFRTRAPSAAWSACVAGPRAARRTPGAHVHELRVAADLGQGDGVQHRRLGRLRRSSNDRCGIARRAPCSLPSTSGRSLLEIVPTSGWSGSVNFLTCCSMRSPNRRAASANCGGVRCWSRITSTACSIHASYSDLRVASSIGLRQVDAGRFRADGLGEGLDGQGHGCRLEAQ